MFALGVNTREVCEIAMMWKTAAEISDAYEFDRRIFATREAARLVLGTVTEEADFRISQDGVRRASIKKNVVWPSQ
jgi:hypothetical protein